MEVPAPPSGYPHPNPGLTPAEHHLALPGFWPAYLAVPQADFEEYGADEADVDAACEALYDATEAWPALRLPLPRGRAVRIVFANRPDDPGVEYILTDPAPRALAPTGTRLTALPWPDLLALAEAVADDGEGGAVLDAGEGEAIADGGEGEAIPDDGEGGAVPDAGAGQAVVDGGEGEAVPEDDGEGVRDAHRRLLLLLPVYAATGAPADEALARTCTALTSIGVPARSAPALAGRLLDRPLWDASGASPLSGAHPGAL
ncbi:hypothetical protein IAG44_31975 [Streptomyces roseirectus]|uniref:Uncharacterized protein n=1 Tax=Streptomyces roseirectus TaxID=2768066 RepID=A0A7H0ILF3_9ACTN|nr:hypothetical protein [Streptomyces roseirectus]QNP73619.1 hypothetical protein IAG44_31975 [Streptomyces roseirectus]